MRQLTPDLGATSTSQPKPTTPGQTCERCYGGGGGDKSMAHDEQRNCCTTGCMVSGSEKKPDACDCSAVREAHASHTRSQTRDENATCCTSTASNQGAPNNKRRTATRTRRRVWHVHNKPGHEPRTLMWSVHQTTSGEPPDELGIECVTCN